MAINLHTVRFGFWNNLSSQFEPSAFHLRSAVLLRSMAQDIAYPVCPFAGAKLHWTFALVRPTHSGGYASAADHPTCFARLPQKSKPW